MSLAVDPAEVSRLEELAFRGWPALERQYRVKLAQVMGERTKRPLPEAPIVQASTIAIVLFVTV